MVISIVLIFFTGSLFAQNARDLPLNTWISGNLRAGGEEWYSVRTNQDGLIIVETSGEMDTYLEAYDAYRNYISEDDDGGDYYNARIEVFAEAGKNYLFKLRFYDSDESGSYRIRADFENIPADTARNTERSRAVPLGSGQQTDVFFRTPGESRWYSFNLTQSGIRFIAYTTGTLDTMLTFYNAQGRLIAEDDDSGDYYNARLAYSGDPGIIYIEVRTWDEVTGRCTLFIETRESNKPDQYENDNTIADAKNIYPGESQQRTFTDADDIDWVRLIISQSGLYSIKTIADDYVDSYLEIYDSRQNLLAEDDDSGNRFDAEIFIYLDAGTYYLRISCYGSDPLEDDLYTLTVARER